MITFLSIYHNRKKELSDFINFMKFLEAKENNKEDGVSEFDKFFHGDKQRIEFTYQSMINVLKSNAALMIYSIIEFTVANLIERIYDEIKMQNLTYKDVSESIRKIWREMILKEADDPNASFNTFLRKHGEVIEAIVYCYTLKMEVKKSLPSGNLDGIAILQTFTSHGIQVCTSSCYYRPDLLKNIKDNRNELAHGNVSFVEALRDKSVDEINDNTNIVCNFLDELIKLVQDYIDNEKYRI